MLASRSDAPGAPTVLLYGHHDVQPPDPLEEWVSPPFEPQIRDGRIYARGAGDNKGQHFAQILALESLLANHGRLPCNVIVLLEGEEEVGSPHMADFVREHRDLLKADLVITADGPVHESGRSCILFGVRGVASFELRARRQPRPALGQLRRRGAQPDLDAGPAAGHDENAQGQVTIDGFYDKVQPPTELERLALDALPVDLERVRRELGLDAPTSRRTGPTTSGSRAGRR